MFRCLPLSIPTTTIFCLLTGNILLETALEAQKKPRGSPEGPGQCLHTALMRGRGVKAGQSGSFRTAFLAFDLDAHTLPVLCGPDPLNAALVCPTLQA